MFRVWYRGADRDLRRGSRGPHEPADRAAAGSYVGCISGALSRREYLDGLTAAGFADASVTFTTEAAPGLHSAIISSQAHA